MPPVTDSDACTCCGVACGGVTHCFVVESSVIPRDAQNSCVGCIALMKLLTPETPGAAQAVKTKPAMITSCLKNTASTPGR
jgi:hypothetical protein